MNSKGMLILLTTAVSGLTAFPSVDRAEYDTVIHPGPADGSGVWNAKAKWFMYAPAFAFKTVPGAVRYRFTVTDGVDTVRTFESDRPTESLARIWSQMPTGDVRVLCEGLSANDREIGKAGERTFWKSAGFKEGTYPKAVRSYREAAIRVFEYVRNMKETAYLLEHGRPDSSYELNTYVSKMMSALVNGMLRYAQLAPEKESDALGVARAAADHLIAKSEPADAPLAFFPPTYDGRGEKDNGYVAEKFQGQIMMIYPAHVASALTALYEKTGDVRYLHHAKGIADTYMRLQGEDGTWFVRIYAKDGRNYSSNRLIPIDNVIPMMETLYRVTGRKAYRDCADRAFASVKGRLEDWNWEGQFEDIDSTAKYVNLTKHDACSTAIYLGLRFPGDIRVRAQMRELIRFAEDQFVCWEQPFGGRTEEGAKSWNSYKDWCVPCVLEQYNCYVPIDASAAKLIRTYLALYKAEGRHTDLAKARALGDTATRMQCPDGRIPTWWWPDRARRIYADWINCMLTTAEALVQLSEFDDQFCPAGSIERSVATSVGEVKVVCTEADGWTFSTLLGKGGSRDRDVVTIRLESPVEAVPPQFDAFFYTSGADVLQVWTPFDERCQLWPFAWGNARYSSSLAYRAPLCAAINNRDRNRCTIAASDAFHRLNYALTVDERTCRMEGRFRFFVQKESPRKSYEVKILIDRRDVFWGDAVREAADWVSATAGLAPATVPESAFNPLYSSWYAFWQDVHAPVLEEEARLAAELGMKTAILDDGWQKERSRTYYSATGDWMPVKSRFPDMKAHVAEVHKTGLKYMLWLSVPFIGDESAVWARFKDKCLQVTQDGVGRLDPRFPEVREYLISTYERAVGEWGFDGLKLDFIDEFQLPSVDPAIAQGYSGRDYKSLPEAVDRLMKDVVMRLKEIRPNVLIEFRQQYMGPAIRQYGNMIRATDCPADLAGNRRRIADLRLTSGTTAVHSDMLVWSPDETPENAARAVLSAIFGVVQYSMVLQRIPAAQKKMMRHWIGFSVKHRDALLKGEFRPHHPEMQYPWIESWNESERIIAAYVENLVLPIAADGKTVYAINASQEPCLVLDFARTPTEVEIFDTFGSPMGSSRPGSGLQRIDVPHSGYVVIHP